MFLSISMTRVVGVVSGVSVREPNTSSLNMAFLSILFIMYVSYVVSKLLSMFNYSDLKGG